MKYEPLHVECARCGKLGTSETFYVEEADEWECPECWERCEAVERGTIHEDSRTTVLLAPR